MVAREEKGTSYRLAWGQDRGEQARALGPMESLFLVASSGFSDSQKEGWWRHEWKGRQEKGGGRERECVGELI